MKALLVLFVAFLLVSATLQADAKRITLEEKHKLMEQRNLLSDSKAFISKGWDQPDHDDDDQEKNPTNANSGNPSSSTGSHHVYRNDREP
ncbi:hypothetical protein Patl1_24856 [Pistacia atlantica]|uniref:Uncharacterized protein n=1 Tax=Pistacia atlantica TaxID=434234 RepID=A0ACC1B1J3_9ROSI|nr:hypothetical protein Patl1_24856 [Pistacia atlantica]